MTPRAVLALGAVFMLVGVAAGAFGAHALRGRVAPDLLAVFQTGVQYHLVHAVALVAVGVLWMVRPQAQGLGLVAILLAGGIVVFSGSLYLLALTGVRAWGAVTPFGGVAWLIAWGVLAWRALQL